MRTLITLSVVAAGLLAFILLFERGTVSDADLASREGRVLQRFFRDRISELTVTAGGETLRLVRRPEQGELSIGTWYVDQPFVAEADQGAVDMLLGELEWMDARRRLTGVSEQDRARFGLERPKFQLSFKVGRDRGELSVGNESPKGDGFYVQVDGDGPVYVVGRELIEALDQAPEHYHSKVLHDGLMALTTYKLVLRLDDQTYRLEKRKGQPFLTAPSEGVANAEVVEQLVDTLDALQAKRFVQSTLEAESDTRFGFAAPFLDVDLVKRTLRSDAAKRSGDARYDFVPVRFRVGAPCGEHEGERYLLVGETGPVMCVAEADVLPVRQAAAQLRETRFVALEEKDVTSIVLEQDGSTLHLRRDGSGFVAEYTPVAAEPTPQTTQAQSVAQWLEELATVQVIALDALPVAAAHSDGDRSLRVEGQSGVIAHLTLRRDHERVLVLREGEPAWSEFPPRAWELTAVDPGRFRQRQLLHYPVDSLRSLDVVAEARQQHLTIDENFAHARVILGAEYPADVELARDLSRRLATLEAQRFAQAPTAMPSARLAEINMEFQGADGAHPHRLLVSIAGEGAEHLAQLDGQIGWFTLPAELVGPLVAPWVAHDLPAIPLEELAALRIEGRASCTVLREGGGFELARSGGSPEQAQRLAEAWATVEASSLEFASPPRRHWTVEQEQVSAERREFWFEVDGGDDRFFLAGLDVAFRLPEGERKALLNCPSGR